MDLVENENLTEKQQRDRQIGLQYLASIADDTMALARTAQDLNWDSGYEPMFVIAQNPNTDVGTAKRLFWMGTPEYYWLTRASADELRTWARDGYPLAELLYTNILGGFYREGHVAFDPADDDGYDWTEGAREALDSGKAVKSLDPMMFEATQGQKVDPGDLEEGFPPGLFRE